MKNRCYSEWDQKPTWVRLIYSAETTNSGEQKQKHELARQPILIKAYRYFLRTLGFVRTHAASTIECYTLATKVFGGPKYFFYKFWRFAHSNGKLWKYRVKVCIYSLETRVSWHFYRPIGLRPADRADSAELVRNYVWSCHLVNCWVVAHLCRVIRQMAAHSSDINFLLSSLTKLTINLRQVYVELSNAGFWLVSFIESRWEVAHDIVIASRSGCGWTLKVQAELCCCCHHQLTIV